MPTCLSTVFSGFVGRIQSSFRLLGSRGLKSRLYVVAKAIPEQIKLPKTNFAYERRKSHRHKLVEYSWRLANVPDFKGND